MTQALSGIRIIDMTHNQAGPRLRPDPGRVPQNPFGSRVGRP